MNSIKIHVAGEIRTVGIRLYFLRVKLLRNLKKIIGDRQW
jgi:hypothetical protein